MIKIDDLWSLFGDCFDRFGEIPDNSVDLILTDPPYGTVRSLKDKHYWDERLDTARMMKECHRVLRPRGAMCLFSQDPYTTELITNCHGNVPFSYRYIWLKNHHGNPMNAKVAPVSVYEDVCVFFKNDTDHRANPLQDMLREELERCGMTREKLAELLESGGVIHHFTTGKVFRFPSRERYESIKLLTGGFPWSYDELAEIDKQFKDDQRTKFPKVFNLPDGCGSKQNVLSYAKDVENLHPTQKPIAMLEDLIQTYTAVGDTVLDFTMGSGSTGVAAMNTGRRFIGIEREPSYYSIATDRILTALSARDTVQQ